MYQLCVGDESLASVIERIVDGACAVAPRLDRDACRDLVELIFRSRVRKTVACGRHPECVPLGSLWGDAEPASGEMCGWQDLDPRALPAMFATAAADVAELPEIGRHEVEERLAGVFRAVLAGLVFHNPNCGRAAVCDAEPLFSLSTPTKAGGR
jgi:hypothetical protein